MKKKSIADTKAVELLQSILDRAAEVGANIVELEQVPEGLEIMYRCGDTGIGGLLETRELGGPLIKLIVERLRRKAEGMFTWKVQGQNRTITVEEYDSFGESCFRLKLGHSM